MKYAVKIIFPAPFFTTLLIRAAISAVFFLAAAAPSAFCAMLPVREVTGPARSTETRMEVFSKTAIAETMALIRTAAAESGLNLLRIAHSSETCPDGNSLKLDCGFAALSLLEFCDFLEFLSEESNAANVRLVSFSVVAETRTARAAAPEKSTKKSVLNIYGISVSLTRHAAGEKTQFENDPSMMAECSAILRYCSSRYEISSALLSEHSGELALSGNFSLKGTKKSLVDYLNGRGRAFEIKEKGYSAIQNQLLIPFLLRIYFQKK